jgi:hypothetical protein
LSEHGKALDHELARLFDRFVEAFAGFEGRRVGALFVAPGVALRRDGTLLGFATQRDIEDYYQAALDRYRAAGCCACRYLDLATHAPGGDVVVATATWELLDGSGAVTARWRQTYFLMRQTGEWRIFGSAYVSG